MEVLLHFGVILNVSQLVNGCYTAKTFIIVEFKYIALFSFSILGHSVMWFQHIYLPKSISQLS